MNAETEPLGGLWAWADGKLYTLAFTPENRHMDHVSWFPKLGLADYGPEFDKILRGRMLWDWAYEHFVLTYYGVNSLPNTVYHQVNAAFNDRGLEVVERPAVDRWIM